MLMPSVNEQIRFTPEMNVDNSQINVIVACATAEKQLLVDLSVPEGTRLAEAVTLSGLFEKFPELLPSSCKMGIYGKVEPPDKVLAEGDRVEIYRPLQISPMQIRLNRAAARKKKKK